MSTITLQLRGDLLDALDALKEETGEARQSLIAEGVVLLLRQRGRLPHSTAPEESP